MARSDLVILDTLRYNYPCYLARVAELVDALASGASEHCVRGGSSPLSRTKIKTPGESLAFLFWPQAREDEEPHK